jgi:arylsulfatase A-like enzyme
MRSKRTPLRADGQTTLGIYSSKSMGRFFFIVSSTALASALIGAWRAWVAFSSGLWSEFGDGLLFWFTWGENLGFDRLWMAAALALVVLAIDLPVQRNPQFAPFRWFHRLVLYFSALPVAASLLALAVLPVAVSSAMQPDAQGKPDVLVILLDTVRADALTRGGCEHNTSPRLDALAAQGAGFSQTVAQSSWTKPSVATLLTGRTPSHHLAVGRPAVNFFPNLENNQRVLAEAYAIEGYDTCAISSNPNIASAFGFAQGFFQFSENFSWRADDILETGNEWLDGRQNDDRPFFMYMHFNDAHYPYRPIAPYQGMFNKGDLEAQLDGRSESAFRLGERDYSVEEVEVLKLKFYEQIRFLDDRVGGFVEEQLANNDNLIVVICADHGEEFLEHGDLGHGHSLYDELILVPLQFSWSAKLGERLGLKAGAHPEQVRLMDVMPTLLELTDLDWPAAAPKLDGESLLPFLLGKPEQDRPAFSESDHPGSPLSGPAGPLRSWREGQWKYIESDRWSSSADRIWLFDLKQDKGETRNLAGQATYGPQLLSLTQALESSGWLVNKPQAPSAHTMLHNAMSASMEELGYAGDVAPEEGATAEFAPGAVPWFSQD